MAYATLDELKGYLGIAGTSDDALLESLLEAATAVIRSYTGKEFQAAEGTRVYDASDVDVFTLLLDGWLIRVSEIRTEAGMIDVSACILIPRNAARHYAIVLPAEGAAHKRYAVTGLWGWSETPPPDIVHACVRLAAYFYRQKDAQVFDVTAFPDAGVITVPKGIPADVKAVLDRYQQI